jgi:hypothetical protein
MNRRSGLEQRRLRVIGRFVLTLFLGVLAGATACSRGVESEPEEARSAFTPQGDTGSEALEGALPTGVPGLVVQLISVTRSGAATVEIELTLIHTGEIAETIDIGHRFASIEGESGSIADVHLVDLAAMKKYFIVRDDDGRPLCSTDVEGIRPGERRVLRATVLAPPVEVESIAVQIPGAPLIENVPIL